LTVWRWRIWAIASITHRITGVGLYVVGMLMFAWFLAALSLGPEPYAMFCSFAASWLGRLILIGLTWAMFQHMASGIRHLVMDTGMGFGHVAARHSAAATFVFSIALTAGLWTCIWLW
jgi:succinate dehydrogenase / fumarate reductase, cytochrome b subunit